MGNWFRENTTAARLNRAILNIQKMDRFVCPVCLENAEDPLLCPRGEHVVCEVCYLELVATSPGSASCPTCRSRGDFQKIGLVTAVCSTLPRMCVCGEQVSRDRRKRHLDDECPCEPTRCEWCSRAHKRRDMEEHKKYCLSNPVLRSVRSSCGEVPTTAQPRPKRTAAKNAEVRIRVCIEIEDDEDC